MCALRGANVKDQLNDLWVNPASPSSFSSPYSLYREARKRGLHVTLKEVRQYLRSQKTFTIYSPVRVASHKPV